MEVDSTSMLSDMGADRVEWVGKCAVVNQRDFLLGIFHCHNIY